MPSPPPVPTASDHARLYTNYSVPLASPSLPDQIVWRYELHYCATFTPMFLPRFDMIQNFYSRVLDAICDYFHFDRLFSKLDRGRRVELCEALFVEARARKWDQETPQRYLQLNLDDEIRALELEQLASGYIRPASDSSGWTVRYPADSLALVRSSPRRGAAGSRYPISVASSREGRGFQGSVHSDGGDGPGAKSGVTRDDILPWKKHEPQGPRSQPQGARVPPARPPRPTLESLRREGAAGLMGSGEPLRGRRQGMARKSAGGTHKPTQVPPWDRTRRPALEIGSGTKRNQDVIGSPAK